MKKIYFILVLLLGLSTYAFAQCNNSDDYAALYALYNSTDGISCKSGAALTNSGSITISNIQGSNSEAITNEATFTNENTGTIVINTVGSSFGILNSSVSASFINNGSITTSNTFLNGLRNTSETVFGGSGSISMNIFENLANLSPGNSPGAITLNGNLVSSGSYDVEIDSKVGIGIGHDYLQVNGDINLDVGINITNNTPGGTKQVYITEN